MFLLAAFAGLLEASESFEPFQAPIYKSPLATQHSSIGAWAGGVYMYTQERIYTHTCTCMQLYVHADVRQYSLNTLTCTCTCTCTDVCHYSVDVHVHVHIYLPLSLYQLQDACPALVGQT